MILKRVIHKKRDVNQSVISIDVTVKGRRYTIKESTDGELRIICHTTEHITISPQCRNEIMIKYMKDV